MKKFGLIVVLIALILSACSQNQSPEAKQLTTNELKNIIISSPQFDAAKHLIQENNLYLDWENAKVTNPDNLYILRIPTQSKAYSFAAYYDSRNDITLGVDILKTSIIFNDIIEVTFVDLNSQDMAIYTFGKSGKKVSEAFGKTNNVTSLGTVFSINKDTNKTQLYTSNLIFTLSSFCSSEQQDVDNAYNDMWYARGDLARELATESVAIASAAAACPSTGVACVLAAAWVEQVGEAIIDAGQALEIAYDDLEDARLALKACELEHSGGGGGGR